VRELLRELSDPASNARSVATIAATDPALAAGLIRTVNSAAMGLRRKVSSISEAVSFLGYSTVRSLVIRTRLDRMMPTSGVAAAYDAEDLWVHSLAVSYAAETLADRIPGVDRGFVSTLGLLHDIGKLAVNSYFPQHAAAIRTISPDHPEESFLDRERRLLGGDHAEIGAILAEQWKLPGDLCQAIRWHHAPQLMPAAISDHARTATTLVHIANQLAKYCYVYSEDMEVDIVPTELLRQVGLPGPLARLLNSPVRRAISRAVFFADENTTGGSGQSLKIVRRFLRLPAKGELPRIAPDPVPGRPSLGWAEEDWDAYLPADAIPVDAVGRARMLAERACEDLGRWARFSARATPQGVELLLAAAMRHMDALPLDEQAKLPGRFLLRRLLANFIEMSPGAPVEVAQGCGNGALSIILRCPALAFAERFGPKAPPRLARAAVERELANVLNLRWFSQVQTTQEGAALLFHGHANGAGI
jgi:putative nucleotidyltransferase with HDIG domain